MNREDCEKLLDAYGAAIEALYIGGSTERVECKGEVVDNLREVIVGIMADEKKPVYRGSGFAVKDVLPPYTTQPNMTGNKPIVTYNGSQTLAE